MFSLVQAKWTKLQAWLRSIFEEAGCFYLPLLSHCPLVLSSHWMNDVSNEAVMAAGQQRHTAAAMSLRADWQKCCFGIKQITQIVTGQNCCGSTIIIIGCGKNQWVEPEHYLLQFLSLILSVDKTAQSSRGPLFLIILSCRVKLLSILQHFVRT